MTPPYSTQPIGPDDVAEMRALIELFGEAFDERETYCGDPPSDAYLRNLLESETFIAATARHESEVVGGLVAYELRKFERERSEIYIYDLAVATPHRRRGVATALLECVRGMAAKRGAWVVFVQADADDPPAVALYSGLGTREDVLHFDLEVEVEAED